MDQPTASVFRTVMIANRGEIACRVIRTVHQMGMTAVAVYTTPDAQALHVRLADRAVHLPDHQATTGYLDIDAVVAAAVETGSDAIHPGYGFLSENADFARACARAGITFIGPDAQALEIMGDKITSKKHVGAAGVPLIQGISEPGLSDEELVDKACSMTFPVLIKPSAGGGGKGMYVAESLDQLPEMLATARRIAHASFGDDTLFIEQLIGSPRHVEVQILADQHGNVIHLGERECSLQRRHQKVIEEAPSVVLTDQTRARIGQAACDTALSVNYRGAGTVEFLVSDHDPDTFYFMEMNTRLQVEHPVTEEITGIDLVEQQLRIAAGESLAYTQDEIQLRGHSVEARVYAEVPAAGFLPSTGTILELAEPAGTGVRVDSGLRRGSVIGTNFDPMLAKVIATGTHRDQALDRLDRALKNMVVLGVQTNISYLRQLINDSRVRAGALDTTMIERILPEMDFPGPGADDAQIVATLAYHFEPAPTTSLSSGWRCDGWRSMAAPTSVRRHVSYRTASGDTEDFDVTLDPSTVVEQVGDHEYLLSTPESMTTRVHAVVATQRAGQSQLWCFTPNFAGLLTISDRQAITRNEVQAQRAGTAGLISNPDVSSPLPGTVMSVPVTSGDQVSAGDTLVIVEAMKMEHRLVAPFDGVVTIHTAETEQVKLGQVLASITPDDDKNPENEPAN
ncbi:biotin carboxylase N-terminal domain-containing protein [Auritidibacter ignavus]|uniref:acetyl/propionyl/methylcrotonyl-CoA carboxylase subunit alpha n=1 Tax=Auritidibacter ignavus TaxID=678932 RepID=UPI00244ADD04|nr:biotin carboxylase N-terminal domain-containing protein [Auritidibacter ignavus]WGH91605.1 biotin carboxylase N-terminal domain-containing protein [Auritidibacter ignavus]